MADLELGTDSILTTALTTNDRITITRAATNHQIATMTIGEFMKKCAEMIPAATAEKNGVMTPTLFSKAFKGASLPFSASNMIGNIADQPSGYGWYNNTANASSENAPARKAGLYVRFKDIYWTVTLFFTSDYQLWWKINDEECKQVLNVGK